MTDRPPELPPGAGPGDAVPKESGGCLKYGGIGCLLLLLAAVVAAGVLFYLAVRPLKDVELTEREQEVVDRKIEYLQEEGVELVPGVKPRDTGDEPPVATNAVGAVSLEDIVERDPDGTRVLRFTEREVNGWLTLEPQFQDLLRLEFERDEIIARMEVDVPEDSPVFAGKRVKLKGRLRVVVDSTQAHISIESLTVAGIAVPDKLLGGLKGDNLIEEMLDSQDAVDTFREVVEEISVGDDEIVIRLAE